MKDMVKKLEALDRQGWRFGLDVTLALFHELGDPQLSLRFAHVAGSNGKGSTCAYLASLIQGAGLKTGLYTSPHLSDIRERFQINGQLIPERDFTHLTKKVLAAGQKVKRRLGHAPTTFEALTGLAALWFQQQKADLVVWETGLGGRLDATNAIPTPVVALISSVDLEHQEWLGKTIARIAEEKAGILKPGGRAAVWQDHPEASAAIRAQSDRVGCDLWEAGKQFKARATPKGFRWSCPGFAGDFILRNRPPYDLANASLALMGYHLLRLQGIVPTPPSAKALAATRWPGRFETVSRKPLALLDGAHNPAGARRLVEGLLKVYPGKKWIVMGGFLKGKNHGEFIRLLAPHTKIALVAAPSSERAEDPARVVNAWEKAGVRAFWVRRPDHAVRLAKSWAGPQVGILATGSLYLLGEYRVRLNTEKHFEPRGRRETRS